MIPRTRDEAAQAPADNERVEQLVVVECLRCGHERAYVPGPRRYQGAGECPRCRYVGWAASAELSEHSRSVYRERTLAESLHLRVLDTLRA